jgi:hypothetical protein
MQMAKSERFALFCGEDSHSSIHHPTHGFYLGRCEVH